MAPSQLTRFEIEQRIQARPLHSENIANMLRDTENDPLAHAKRGKALYDGSPPTNLPKRVAKVNPAKEQFNNELEASKTRRDKLSAKKKQQEFDDYARRQQGATRSITTGDNNTIVPNHLVKYGQKSQSKRVIESEDEDEMNLSPSRPVKKPAVDPRGDDDDAQLSDLDRLEMELDPDANDDEENLDSTAAATPKKAIQAQVSEVEDAQGRNKKVTKKSALQKRVEEYNIDARLNNNMLTTGTRTPIPHPQTAPSVTRASLACSTPLPEANLSTPTITRGSETPEDDDRTLDDAADHDAGDDEGGSGSKIKESEFDADTRQVLKRTIPLYMVKLATVNAFPDPDKHFDFIAEAFTEASDYYKNKKATLTAKVVAYVKYRSSTLRREVKNSAHTYAPTMFGFKSSGKGYVKYNKTLATELLSTTMRFCYEDPKALIGMVNHPFIYTIIAVNFFATVRQLGFRFASAFGGDPSAGGLAPLPLLALVITAMECCIDEYKDGSRKSVHFTSAAYQTTYDGNLQALLDWEKQFPERVHSCRSTTLKSARNLNGLFKTSKPKVDRSFSKDAMEKDNAWFEANAGKVRDDGESEAESSSESEAEGASKE